MLQAMIKVCKASLCTVQGQGLRAGRHILPHTCYGDCALRCQQAGQPRARVRDQMRQRFRDRV